MQAADFTFTDEDDTRRWAGALATALAPIALAEQGFAVHLRGDLGSGKTTLVRHLLAALGIPGPVKSPSYALLEPYNGPSFGVYHFDLYRFSTPEQWLDAGFDEIVAGPGLVLVEWPEQAEGVLAPPDLEVALEIPVDEGPGEGRRGAPNPDSGHDSANDPADDPEPGSDLAGDALPGQRRLRVQPFSEAGRQCLTVLSRSWPSAATG